MIARYTDGAPVIEGDRVRYHQMPGGLMAPQRFWTSDGWAIWREGIAAKFPGHQERREELLTRGYIDPDELHLLGRDGRYYHMAPHIIERLP